MMGREELVERSLVAGNPRRTGMTFSTMLPKGAGIASNQKEGDKQCWQKGRSFHGYDSARSTSASTVDLRHALNLKESSNGLALTYSSKCGGFGKFSSRIGQPFSCMSSRKDSRLPMNS